MVQNVNYTAARLVLCEKIVFVLAIILLVATLPVVMAETYSTEATVSVTPYDVHVNVQARISATISPPPPEGFTYQGILFDITRPDGETFSLGPFETDGNGTATAFYIPNLIGTYDVRFEFSEQTVNGSLYSATEVITEFAALESDEIPSVSNPDGTPPVASFTISPLLPEVGVDAIFDASESYDSDGSIVKYIWDFGDGTTESGVKVPHVYQANGSYSVVLAVIDNEGCVGNATRTLSKLAPMWSSVSQPSVPEFSLKLEANPYYVPPVYSVDQYTGENVTTKEGYYVENKSIVITIKNQPFTSYVNGKSYEFHYNVQAKGHFGEHWNNIYSYANAPFSLPTMSDSEYTVLRVSAEDYPSGALVDFQVEATVWHQSLVLEHDYIFDFVGHVKPATVLYGSSGFGEPQTITINISNTTEPSNDPPAPEQPEPATPETAAPEPQTTNEDVTEIQQLPINLGIAVPALVAVAVTCVLAVYFLKRRR